MTAPRLLVLYHFLHPDRVVSARIFSDFAAEQALRDADAGTRTLLFPTHMNLLKLARYASVAEAVAVTRKTPIVSVMPRVERTATGRTLHIPAEACYGVTQFAVAMPAPKR